MALVFQYGSNLSTERLNGPRRLRGDAHVDRPAITEEDFEFRFDIPSRGYAASNIVRSSGRKIWGVVYKIPDYLIRRETARACNRRSLDAIEGQGENYDRVEIKVRWPDGSEPTAPVITYLGCNSKSDIKPSSEYVAHILKGLKEHKLPEEYVRYVRERILQSNAQLRELVDSELRLSPE
jgi:gamma-glutamylcyclotransferase (GGCT)/AIG2-like uncharacterized protein YtfP